MSIRRRIAIAVPAHNEAERLGASLRRLATLDRDDRIGALRVLVLANNCQDATVAEAASVQALWPDVVRVRALTLAPERAHAGWARRLALEAAAEDLRAPGDVLMSTDADTLPAQDWLLRTLDHLDAGWDAVAGLARLMPRELRQMDRTHRLRLAMVRRYQAGMDRLKAARDPAEPWPRHFYEGGASLALTLSMFRRIGPLPTPPVGEDKALFEAVRAAGGRVRHAMDVRVMTSPRLAGRAPGGASDTLALWGRQPAAAPIEGLETLTGERLTFDTLAQQTRRVRMLARQASVSAEAA